MSNQDLAIAEVYSRAILDLAATRDGAIEAVGEELAFLARHAESDTSFQHFLSSPMVDGEDRKSSIDRMFRGKLSDTTVDALQVINDKGRLALLPEIAETYRQQLMERRDEVEVDVRTAVPVDPATRDKIVATVTRFTGKQPILNIEVDDSLVGGMVLQVGDRKIDASVRHEIEKYRRLLEERASLELLRHRQETVAQA